MKRVLASAVLGLAAVMTMASCTAAEWQPDKSRPDIVVTVISSSYSCSLLGLGPCTWRGTLQFANGEKFQAESAESRDVPGMNWNAQEGCRMRIYQAYPLKGGEPMRLMSGYTARVDGECTDGKT